MTEPTKMTYCVTDTHIQGFFKEHRFLSNFHVHPIMYRGITYYATENAYQAAKIDPDVPQPNGINCRDFCNILPKDARRKGRELALRSDWHNPLQETMQERDGLGSLIETHRDHVMYELNLLKFANSELGAKLLATGDKYLEETNYWGDDYWGVNHATNTGLNKLGRILMRIRENLQIETMYETAKEA